VKTMAKPYLISQSAFSDGSALRRRTGEFVAFGLALVCFFACNPMMGADPPIRGIDFKTFSYPFSRDYLTSVPLGLTWISHLDAGAISLRDGRYRFPCDGSQDDATQCPLMTLDEVVFGDVAGLFGTSAIVVTTYHTGGTATWQYVYVVSLRSGVPRVVACLETGSRAYMGLRRLAVSHGELVVTVNDPAKIQGLCCSSGTIDYRYRWQDPSFQQDGEPAFRDDPR
jgi:hypothetical protein